jgi:hypothetical protein
MNYIRYTLAALAIPVLIVAGCEDRYRYACQDSKNWDKPVCEKPRCEIHRSCPEHVFPKGMNPAEKSPE